VRFGNVQKGVLNLANNSAVEARNESKTLQEMVAAEKKEKLKRKKIAGRISKRPTKTAKKSKQSKQTKSKERSIVKIYGHELYKGDDYEECGAEWFHVQYSNGDKECVTAVVVAREVPGLGAEYIFDNCLGSEEDINSYGEWLEEMQNASNRTAQV
jgi:hypothetical protein